MAQASSGNRKYLNAAERRRFVEAPFSARLEARLMPSRANPRLSSRTMAGIAFGVSGQDAEQSPRPVRPARRAPHLVNCYKKDRQRKRQHEIDQAIGDEGAEQGRFRRTGHQRDNHRFEYPQSSWHKAQQRNRRSDDVNTEKLVEADLGFRRKQHVNDSCCERLI